MVVKFNAAEQVSRELKPVAQAQDQPAAFHRFFDEYGIGVSPVMVLPRFEMVGLAFSKTQPGGQQESGARDRSATVLQPYGWGQLPEIRAFVFPFAPFGNKVSVKKFKAGDPGKVMAKCPLATALDANAMKANAVFKPVACASKRAEV